MLMNVQLHHVVTDITGVTGMKIIRAIPAEGVRDPKVLAEHRDRRCKESIGTIRQALGRELSCRTCLCAPAGHSNCSRFHHTKVAECDVEVEAELRELNEDRSAPEEHRYRRRDTLAVVATSRSLTCALGSTRFLGADLSQIHGFGPYNRPAHDRRVRRDDMRKWPTVKHFTSWFRLAPGNKISGGRLLSSSTRKSANRAGDAAADRSGQYR